MTTGRTSFAFDNRGGSWSWYEDAGAKVPIDEIRHHVTLLRDSEGEIAAVDFRNLISHKLRCAERGTLQVPDDGRPQLARAPGVMEIKWGIERVAWRLYFCEPPQLYSSRIMLGLHFAQKDTLATQDQDIDEAARRWTAWQARQHG